MRTLEEIEKDLTAAKADLGAVVGTPTEVYSRIVGYYRSVRNWNRGKREEYGERRLYDAGRGIPERRRAQPGKGTSERSTGTAGVAGARVLLFVRSACPGCPPAKDAAAKLPVAVELVDADTATGLARAEQLQVFSTPTAILVDAEGREIRRARNAREIAAFSDNRDLAAAASQ
jgi:ribonucleoside-triphosphate reductase